MKLKSSLFLAVAGTCALFFTDFAQAQPGAAGGAAGGMRGMFSGNDGMNLLRNPKIQEELELVEDQITELNNLRDEMMLDMRESFRGMRDMDDAERQAFIEEMRTKMEVRQKEAEEQVNNILLPHQQKRLKQIVIQSQARRSGGGANGVLSNDKIKEELNITVEQEQELKEKAEKVKKELDEKIQKLQAEAEKEILSVLTSEQRTKYLEMIGNAFNFGDDGGGRLGGRGGPGGPGGPGGRGGRGGTPGGDGDQPRSDF